MKQRVRRSIFDNKKSRDTSRDYVSKFHEYKREDLALIDEAHEFYLSSPDFDKDQYELVFTELEYLKKLDMKIVIFVTFKRE